MTVEAVAGLRLYRHPALRGLVAAELTSMIGTQLSAVAIPWFVLRTTGSARDMGLVMAAQWAGIAVVGLVGAGWAGRLGPRRTMLAADLLCAPLMALVPVLHWYHALDLVVVMVVMFVVGGCTGPYLASQQAMLTDLAVDEALLSRANAALQGATRLATLAGPAAAGILIATLQAPGTLLLDSASFALSAVIVWRYLPPAATAGVGRRPALRAGVRVLFTDRLLGAWSFALVLAETAWQALFALLPVMALVRYHGSPAVAGTLIATFGGGAMAGTLLLGPALRKTSPRRLAVAGRIALGVAFTALLMPLSLLAMIVCLAVVGLLNGLSSAPVASVRLLRIPALTRSETLTVATAMALSGGTVGWVMAGAIAQSTGLATALAVTVAVQATAAALFVFGAIPARATTSEG